jgi:ABC-type Fe3+/spermidine/putrescine transport system ATPase subunit
MQFDFDQYSIEVPGKGSTVVNGRAEKSWALLGPSGCGKSTFLRSLCGFWPSQGRFLMGGVEQSNLSPQERGLALMSQKGGLFGGQTVLENLLFALSHRPQFKDYAAELKRERALQRLSQINLLPLASKLVDDLSGGEARRIALLRALLSEPRALLLDEPFTGLDSKSKESTMHFFKDFVLSQEVYFVLVTHDASEVDFFQLKRVEYSKCIEV